MWKMPDFAAMVDATAAVMLVDATQACLPVSFPASVGENDAALLLVGSCADARDAAATAFEDEVRILLGGKNMENGVAALLSGLGSLRSVWSWRGLQPRLL